jgi:hypothetical protein
MALIVAQSFGERSNGAGGAAGASFYSGRACTAEQPAACSSYAISICANRQRPGGRRLTQMLIVTCSDDRWRDGSSRNADASPFIFETRDGLRGNG